MIHTISFPRSGHNLLNDIFCKWFEYNNKSEQYTYCEFYNCCNNFPCKNNSLVTKNHDYTLNLKINQKLKYVIQYRKDPILQLDAYFRHTLKNKEKLDYDNPIYYSKLLSFIIGNIKYYKQFTKKWIIKNDNFFIIEYYDFVNNYSDILFNLFIWLNLIKEDSKDYFLAFIEFYTKNHKIELKNSLEESIYQKVKQDLQTILDS